MKIVISSGHGKYIRGARGNPVPPQLDEVDAARPLVERIAEFLRVKGVSVTTYHDDVSRTQSENLTRIVDFHNSQGPHDYDVSVHFNAYDHSAHGTECLYYSQSQLAEQISNAVAHAGPFTNRGGKRRTDLAFLRNTAEPSVLIETCFCDHTGDCNTFNARQDEIAEAIAATLVGEQSITPEPEPDEPLFEARGRCSWFGGPADTGVSPSEGLAFIYSYDQRPDLFLPQQPPGTTGLARRLNPDVPYIACRWDYAETSKELLASKQYQVLVRANGRELLCWPADWGPHSDTSRIADLSPGAMTSLGIETDDEVEVIYPAPSETDELPPEPPIEPSEPSEATIAITTSGPVTLNVIVNGQLIPIE